jgi:hypothetical protein
MKATLQIERPYVHGVVQITRQGDRIHVVSNTLTVNAVPVIIEGVIVRGQLDQWRMESFKVQRMERAKLYYGKYGTFKTSRRNQERARDEVLRCVAEWAGGRQEPVERPQPVYDEANSVTLGATLRVRSLFPYQFGIIGGEVSLDDDS